MMVISTLEHFMVKKQTNKHILVIQVDWYINIIELKTIYFIKL